MCFRAVAVDGLRGRPSKVWVAVVFVFASAVAVGAGAPEVASWVG